MRRRYEVAAPYRGRVGRQARVDVAGGYDVDEAALESAGAHACDPLERVRLYLRDGAAGGRAAGRKARADDRVAGQRLHHQEQAVLERRAGDGETQVDGAQGQIGAWPCPGDPIGVGVGDPGRAERAGQQPQRRVAVHVGVHGGEVGGRLLHRHLRPGWTGSPVVGHHHGGRGRTREGGPRVPGTRGERGQLRSHRGDVRRRDDGGQLGGHRDGWDVRVRQTGRPREPGNERAQRGQAARIGNAHREDRHALERGHDLRVQLGEQGLHLGDGGARRQLEFELRAHVLDAVLLGYLARREPGGVTDHVRDRRGRERLGRPWASAPRRASPAGRAATPR